MPTLNTTEQAIVDRFNAATSAVAKRIHDLIANTPPDSPEFLSALGDIATGLEKMGAPGTPLPPTP